MHCLIEEEKKIYLIVSFIDIQFRLCDFKRRTLKEVEKGIGFCLFFPILPHPQVTLPEY